MLVFNCCITVECLTIAFILELEILAFQCSLALKMIDFILGRLEAKCEPQHKTRLPLQVHPA